MELHDECKGKPAFDLRQKAVIDPALTDLQIFLRLPDDADCWTDAKLPTVFLYLIENENLRIPEEWYYHMMCMKANMQKYVTWFANTIVFSTIFELSEFSLIPCLWRNRLPA